ncbi:unnamed protein product [Ranitomeya imitator]|uniref:Helix-turn-helix domain-containing protein n=1 Tax=Ranitomeya imitator TaxID=111125 RepID=A0ABN9LJZ4_9NEOB|nr:unnamed protein product [Ranitomeya imitator]
METYDLELLMQDLNKNNQNIKLTYQFGHKIEFLDLSITVQPNGRLSTTVYRKPTATNSLLHASSSHLKSTINGIPIGQFLRVKRICSEHQEFEIQSETLKKRFQDRGYNKKVIEKGYRRARETPREVLLHKNQPLLDHDKNDQQVRFITNYSTGTLKNILPKFPSFVAKRAPNLRDILTHSTYDPKRKAVHSKCMERKGFYPCGMCKGCVNMQKSLFFWNFDQTRKFEIRAHITCATKGVIYYAQCPCQKIYIGMTSRELKIRVREHCLDIEKARTNTDDNTLKTLAKHFKKFHQ